MRCQCDNKHEVYVNGQWFCNTCGSANGEKRRRGMSEYERMKLSWYRNEKNWIANIKRRKIVHGANNRPVCVLTDEKGNIKERMPSPPREIWAKPSQTV